MTAARDVAADVLSVVPSDLAPRVREQAERALGVPVSAAAPGPSSPGLSGRANPDVVRSAFAEAAMTECLIEMFVQWLAVPPEGAGRCPHLWTDLVPDRVRLLFPALVVTDEIVVSAADLLQSLKPLKLAVLSLDGVSAACSRHPATVGDPARSSLEWVGVYLEVAEFENAVMAGAVALLADLPHAGLGVPSAVGSGERRVQLAVAAAGGCQFPSSRHAALRRAVHTNAGFLP